jgi:hypothetical protein
MVTMPLQYILDDTTDMRSCIAPSQNIMSPVPGSGCVSGTLGQGRSDVRRRVLSPSAGRLVSLTCLTVGGFGVAVHCHFSLHIPTTGLKVLHTCVSHDTLLPDDDA